MSKNKAIATVGSSVANKMLAGINANLSVSMDDVVSAVVSRYEDNQIEQRKTYQVQMAEVTKQITKLSNSVLSDTKEKIIQNMSNYNLSNMFITTKATVREDSIKLEWSDKRITFAIDTLTVALNPSVTYNKETSGYVTCAVPLVCGSIVQYEEFMSEKAELMAKLAEINTNLRDVGRQERKVRGMIAERKLEELGMTDLLADPSIQLLMNGPTE